MPPKVEYRPDPVDLHARDGLVPYWRARRGGHTREATWREVRRQVQRRGHMFPDLPAEVWVTPTVFVYWVRQAAIEPAVLAHNTLAARMKTAEHRPTRDTVRREPWHG